MIAVTTLSIGHRVTTAREARAWTQSDLARRSGVSASYISRLESGEFTRPSHENLAAIARSLGIRVSDLTDPPADESTDDLRRAIVERLGPDQADLGVAIVEKMQGRPAEDLETVLNVVDVLLSGMSRKSNTRP